MPELIFRQERRFKFLSIAPELKRPALVSIFIASISSLLVLSYVSIVQPEVPLFYSLSRPEDQLVNKNWLLILPGISVLIVVGHLILAQLTIKNDPTIAKLFLWITLIIISLLLFVGLRLFVVL